MSPEMIPIVSQRFMLKRPFRAGEIAGDSQGTARGPFRVDESARDGPGDGQGTVSRRRERYFMLK